MNIRQPFQLTSERTRKAGHPAPPRVVIAEDDDEMRVLLTWSLRWEGYNVVQCRNGMELFDVLTGTIADDESGPFALVISDIRMPGISGLEVLRGLELLKEFPPMILITAFGTEETHAEAARLGAIAVFDKPFEMENLIAKTHEILDDYHDRLERGDQDADPEQA